MNIMYCKTKWKDCKVPTAFQHVLHVKHTLATNITAYSCFKGINGAPICWDLLFLVPSVLFRWWPLDSLYQIRYYSWCAECWLISSSSRTKKYRNVPKNALQASGVTIMTAFFFSALSLTSSLALTIPNPSVTLWTRKFLRWTLEWLVEDGCGRILCWFLTVFREVSVN